MSLPTALRQALWSGLLGLLGLLVGCGSLPFGSESVDAVKPEPPRPPQFRLQVSAPPALQALLLEHLDLARLQHAAEADSLTPGEIDRLIGAASAQSLSLLQTEGYFNPVVEAQRVNDGGALPLLRIDVQPGPRAVIGRLTIEIQGDMYDRVAAGDADAQALLQAIQSEWPLQPGKPFQQSTWDSAKNGVLASLRRNGYLGANWSGTAAQVNADANSVRLFVVADSNMLYRIGELRTVGLQRYDDAAILPMARELVGQPATERVLRDMQDRILTLGLFESVIIDVDAAAPDPSAAPALLALRELPLQQATVGIGYADNTGAQLTLEHTHRRVFDTRWLMRNKLQVGQYLNAWTGDLISHLQDDGYQNLLAGQVEDLRSDDEKRLSAYARIGRTRDSVRIWRLMFGEYTRARLETSAGVNDSSALSGNYHWTWRDVDDLRTPTRGTVWNLQVGAGYARGVSTPIGGSVGIEDAGPFTRLYGRAQAFLPLGSSYYGSGRVELGQVIVKESLAVPDTLLFRAGGDASVRGYAYRSLGPEINGATVSGNALFTASVQLAHPIIASQPDFLWAVFVDAGNASDGWRDMRPVFGYGFGVHWRSPVGPLRMDLAYGQETQKLRLHFSVGVVF